MRVVFLALLSACFSPSPQAGAPCGLMGECPDGLKCSPLKTCEEPDFVCPDPVCDGDMLLFCGETLACTYGCNADGVAHCFQLKPSNGVTVDLLDGAIADVAEADMDFNTDDGSIKITDSNNMLIKEVRPAGPGVINGIRFEERDGMGIFAANSWTFGASSDDTDAAGNNAFVLMAKTTISVGAVVDAGANGTSGGPDGTSRNSSTTGGGCRGRAGRSNSGVGSTFGEGGGGGGGATVGGDGAASNQAGATGVGGAICSTAPDTIPLRGGNAGGDGGQSSANGGGGGGGAMMLVAMESITIASGGAVAAPGAGGLSGTGAAGNGGGGGGGGGAVLLEAPIVDLAGAITANGGGGGAPTGGDDGVRGTTTSRAAASGAAFSCVPTPGATPVTVRGGAGGFGSTAATDGATCTQQDAAMAVISSQGAGGGGAAGRTHIRRRTGMMTGTQSPTATVEDVDFQ